MNTVIKYIVVMVVVVSLVGAAGGENILRAVYTSIPILIPVTYLSHIIFYEYDIQEDYLRLFHSSGDSCTRSWPGLFAVAVFLLGEVLAVLIDGGIESFTIVSFSLVTFIAYYLDKRKDHKAYRVLMCKLFELVGKT